MTINKLKNSIRTVKFTLNSQINDFDTIFKLVPIDNSQLSKVRIQNSYSKRSKKWIPFPACHPVIFASYDKCERGYYSCGNFGNILQMYIRSPLRNTSRYPKLSKEKAKYKLYLHTKISRSSITVSGAQSMEEARIIAQTAVVKINNIRNMLSADDIIYLYQPEYNNIEQPTDQEFRDINERVAIRVRETIKGDIRPYLNLIKHIMCQPPMTEVELITLLDCEPEDISENELTIVSEQCVMCNYFYNIPLIPFDDIIKIVEEKIPSEATLTTSRSEIQGAQLTIRLRLPYYKKHTTFTITSPNSVMQSSPNEEEATELYLLLNKMLEPKATKKVYI